MAGSPGKPIAVVLPLALLLLASSSFAVAQDVKLPDGAEQLHVAPPPSELFPAKWYPPVGSGNEIVPAPFVDHPYTATTGTIPPQQRAGVEPRSPVVEGFEARDRFGRTRAESVNGGMTVGGQSVQMKEIEVSDPVSHCSFNWMETTTGATLPADSRVAWVSCAPQSLRYKDFDIWKSVAEEMKDGTVVHGDTTTTIEHLPPVNLDGLTVQRLRVTNISVDEHGQPRKWITESWYSPELKELIRLRNEDGGFEGSIHVQRDDPDPKLFYPPEGYRIELQPAQ